MSTVSSPTEQPAEAPAASPPRTPAPVPSPRPATGLSTAGVIVIVLAASVVGLLIGSFTGGGIGWIFGVFFVAASAYAALTVRRPDRWAAVITPPIVFAILILAHSIADGGGLATIAVKTANDLLTYGPILWIGTGVAAAIVGFRSWQLRRTAS